MYDVIGWHERGLGHTKNAPDKLHAERVTRKNAKNGLHQGLIRGHLGQPLSENKGSIPTAALFLGSHESLI